MFEARCSVRLLVAAYLLQLLCACSPASPRCPAPPQFILEMVELNGRAYPRVTRSPIPAALPAQGRVRLHARKMEDGPVVLLPASCKVKTETVNCLCMVLCVIVIFILTSVLIWIICSAKCKCED